MNKCAWCSGNHKDLKVKPCGNGDLGARVSVTKCPNDETHSLILYVDKNTASGYADINFCPMCGRCLNRSHHAFRY